MTEQLTLNKITDDIADAMDKPFDVRFKERIKFAVLYWRAELIRRDGERNNISKVFLNSFVTNLIDVDYADNCVIDIGCTVKRTKDKIPVPIRPKDVDSLFQFVGTADGTKSYALTDLEMLIYYKESKFTGKAPRYVYMNGYIYVYHNKKTKYLRVSGVFFDPRVISEVTCDDQPCATDDDELAIGGDQIRTISDGIIQGKLRMPKPSDEEVRISDEEVEIQNTRPSERRSRR